MTCPRHCLLLCLIVSCLCLPLLSHAQSCLPTFGYTQSGWLIKYFYPRYSSDRTLRVFSDCPAQISTGALRTLSEQAYALWYYASGYSTPPFTYQTVTSYPSTTLPCVVMFDNTWEYILAGGEEDGSPATCLKSFEVGTGNIVRTRILVDGSYGWAPTCAGNACAPDKFSLLGALVHEWGHGLGLEHPVGDCLYLSVMEQYGLIYGSDWQETLKDRDAYRIGALYQGYPVLVGLSFRASPGPAADTLYWSETEPRYCWYDVSVSDACWGPYTHLGRVMGLSVQDQYSFIAPAEYNRDYWYQLTVEEEGDTVETVHALSSRTEGTAPNIPGVPTGLTADGTRPGGGVALSWQPSAGTVDGYYVYRGGVSLEGCEQQVATFGPTTDTTLVDESAEPGVPLAYCVRAFNSTSSSEMSEQAVTEVPAGIVKCDTVVVGCPRGDAGSIAFAVQLYWTDGVFLGDPGLEVVAVRNSSHGSSVRVWEEEADTLRGVYSSTTHQATFMASRISGCGDVGYDVYAAGHLVARDVTFSLRSYDLSAECLGSVDSLDVVTWDCMHNQGSGCSNTACGDFNGDSVLTNDDLAALRAHMGHHVPRRVLYPNGGEAFANVGDSIGVAWEPLGGDSALVSLYLVRDDAPGARTVLNENLPDTGYFAWPILISDATRSDCRIEVVWSAGTYGGWNETARDSSDATFTILDVCRPAPVADLAVVLGRTTAAVSWTAPGDDSLAGTATAYDLRYSSSPITGEAGFGTATPVEEVPEPSEAGSVECVELRWLTRCRMYYFALKTQDDAGN